MAHPPSRAEEARRRRIMAKFAPYSEQTATIKKLLDQFYDNILATIITDGTNKASLDALITDLTEMAEHWATP